MHFRPTPIVAGIVFSQHTHTLYDSATNHPAGSTRLEQQSRTDTGSNESRGGQTGARRGGEAKLGAPAGLSARIQSSRPNNQRPVSRVIEIKGRPLERHELQQGGGHQHHEVDHQHHHQQQQGHFASADSGISSLNTSTTGSRKSARHTMIH